MLDKVGKLKVRPGGLLAAGGIAGALLASSCCVLPLALVTLGAGGAWIGSLTAFAPLKPYFLAATAVLIGAGFWRVYAKPRQVCDGDAACANAESRRFTKIALWAAAALALAAATIDLWAPLFY